MTDYFGTIKGGLDWLKDKNQDTLIGIELIKSKRSIDQNKLYWKYLSIISQDTGNSINSLHECFKQEFLPPRFSQVIINDRIFQHELPASTTQLDKSAFINYLDQISALSGIPIPQI